MSNGSRSELGAEAAGADRRDSVYSPLQGLDSLKLQPLVQDRDWQGNSDFRANFQERAIEYGNYYFPDVRSPGGGVRINPLHRSPSESPSSMALTMHSHLDGSFVSDSASGRSFSTYSPPPSLASGPTISSVQSSIGVRAERIVRAGPFDEDGYLQIEDVQCDWGFMGCDKQVPIDDWHEHSKSHFRGRGLPTCVYCPFAACSWDVQAISGEAAWEERIKHIAGRHDLAVESQEGWRRPDMSLIQHLWNKRIITAIQKQELRLHGRISVQTDAFTRCQGPEDDERRRRGERREHTRRG